MSDKSKRGRVGKEHYANSSMAQNVVRALIASCAMYCAPATVQATIVTDNLLVWYDAQDSHAAGTVGLGSGSTWVNKASTGAIYNGNLLGIDHGSAPVWAGSGSTTDPYVLQFHSSGGTGGSVVQIQNSYDQGSALNSSTFTYEVWAEITGPGTGLAGTPGGSLVSHNTNGTGQGNGSISYSLGSFGGNGLYANTLYTESGTTSPAGKDGSIWTFPDSEGRYAAPVLQQIVFTHSGTGNGNSAWYLNGVPMGTFYSDSNASSNSWLELGGRSYWTFNDVFADANMAVVRIYDAALTPQQVAQNFQADSFRLPLAGDLNNDGMVNLTDYEILKSHWLQSTASGAAGGDLNLDGQVDLTDFAIFRQDYQSFNGAGGAALNVVPEPSSLTIAGAMCPALLLYGVLRSVMKASSISAISVRKDHSESRT